MIIPCKNKCLIKLIAEIKSYDSSIIDIIHNDEYKLALFEVVAQNNTIYKEGSKVITNMYILDKTEVTDYIDDGNRYFIVNEKDIYMELL